jgi:uncharacterized protein with HEPN domain
MTNAVKKRLLDAKNACQAILNFTSDTDFAAYESNLLLRSAVERQLEIIGEALGKADELEEGLKSDIPALPRIVALRNRVIHGYDSVDHQIVWDIIQTKVPVLHQQLETLLSE